MQAMRRTKGFSSTCGIAGGSLARRFSYSRLEINTMNATRLILAAGLAIAASGALAETGVTTVQPGHVAQVYGRASSPAVTTFQAAPRHGNVADAGQDSAKGDTKVAVTAGKDAIEFGRS